MSMLRILLPIVLGIVAAVLNFMVLRGNTAPVELTTVRSDIKADTELADDMLDRLSVRADPEIFKSAVLYKDRGALVGRRVTRSLGRGEVVLYGDVQNLDEENIRAYLKPGESTLTIPIKPGRIALGLQRGDLIGVRVPVRSKTGMVPSIPGTAPSGRRILGPFRLLSLGMPSDSNRTPNPSEARMVMVAITRQADGRLDSSAADLDEAITAGLTPGSGLESDSLAVEYYQPAK